MATAHLDADAGAIADTVLLPGDPLRARHVAGAFLEDVREINTRRNMLGYTGYRHGQRVSVIGSGMGIPSCAIYATELAREYGVRRIVRIGTCGGIGDLALGTVLFAQAASTDSRFNRLNFGEHDFSACADFGLLRAMVDAAGARGLPTRVAHVFSTDCFHDGDPGLLARLQRHRIAAIEMESAGLYGVAAREGFCALSVLVVSDLLPGGARMPADERERGASRMLDVVFAGLAADAAD